MHMQDFSFIYSPWAWGAFGLIIPLVALLIVFTIVLKGFSLWYAARAGQKIWFIALLVVNTLGILEVVYLLFFRPDAPYKHVLEKNRTPTASSKE